MTTRHISKSATAILWGRAAGRCEFAGCNQVLWKSPVTQEPVNIAQMAHIYSFSPKGPRGRGAVSDGGLNAVGNLLLVCHACHRKIDQKQDGGRYPAALLRQMKQDHERRIEIVTGVAIDRRSTVLLYGANIGQHSSPLNFEEAASAMFPAAFPDADQAIELGAANSGTTDRDETYWEMESRQLRTLFERRVRERVSDGEITHLSVFGIAPQPLLILLGTLLGDIVPASVYQRHREPPTWAWPTSPSITEFLIHEPTSAVGPAALVLGVSATITPDRIRAVLGDDACIWSVSVSEPHNDMLKSPQQLSQFRALMRSLLDRIKAAHGQRAPLHIFPAAPVSVAIELGRVRMPKADMSWEVYDQVNALGGFVRAISLTQKD
ncbi:MAG TPA: SAVED domain-containing protein [Planctomycetaceae bacterium]|nr:SAVED domain-containing protein [Planctomycetaceae bacterium]